MVGFDIKYCLGFCVYFIGGFLEVCDSGPGLSCMSPHT